MIYDYKDGKERILDILNDQTKYQIGQKIPTDDKFTFDNGYYGWVTAIFVDIRESTKLFSEKRKASTAKIIRCFTSEIIEILEGGKDLREIGIRGDCVYAIYAAEKIEDNLDLLDRAFYVRTYLKMLNAILKGRGMKTINAGIGISRQQDLVIKAGRKNKNINNKVWIGEAVTYASKLSNYANKGNTCEILLSNDFYNFIINEFKKDNSNYKDSWFIKYNHNQLGVAYGADLYMTNFNNWINGGMKDE